MWICCIADENESDDDEGSDEGVETVPRARPNARGNLTAEEKLQIVSLVSQGMSYTEVGERLHVDRRTVSRVFQRWETEQTIERRKVPGRPRKTSAQDDLAIIISVKRNRFITAKQIKDQCSLPNVCDNTIRSRIKEKILNERKNNCTQTRWTHVCS